MIRDVELKYPQKNKEFAQIDYDEIDEDFEENSFPKKKNIRIGADKN